VGQRGAARVLLSANSLALLAIGILPQTLMVVCLEAIRFSL